MFNMPQINFKVVSKEKNVGVFEITPLVRGFAYTIGSALRRTLYSSTKGAAVTKAALVGVSHEFTTIAGATEDVLEILLNLKEVRFKKEVDEPVELKLEATGPGAVKAGDIEEASGVKVVNKDLVITTLADKKSKIKAKLTVESGYGYSIVDENAKIPVGTILLDSNFSPVVNVAVSVEPTRVGRDANFDKLTLTVETDGTIDPEESIRNAASILKEFFYKVQTGKDYTPEIDEEMTEKTEVEEETTSSNLSADEVSLEELHLPTRTINALRKAGIKTLGDLADRSEDELLRVRNLGEKSIREILNLLQKEGLK